MANTVLEMSNLVAAHRLATMPFPITYAEAIDNDILGEANYALTGSQQWLLMLLANNVQDDPSLWFSDYNEHDPEEITDWIDDLIRAIQADNMIVIPEFNPVALSYGNIRDWTGVKPSFDVVTGQWGGGYFQQTTPTGDELINFDRIYFPVGDYKVRFLHNKTNSSGIVQIKLGSSIKHTVDTYNSTALNDQISESATFTISDAGYYTPNLKSNGKNPSSASYLIRWKSLTFYKDIGV